MATNISFSTYGFMNGILILSEENWRRFFKPFITDSVQSGLATIAGANMTVYVSAGECRCGAVMGILDEMVALDVANGDSTYDRIDSVIVQYTYGEPSTLAVAIVQGTPSANPVPPTLTKVYDTLWQMEIAQILVPSGATSSSEFTITDKRVIYESIESIIDDNTESEERVWSSQKSREEIVSLSTEIYDSLNTKADVIERTVSGDIVTITDGGNNLPVKELVVDIEPVQDLHGYDNPWPAGGGKNLFNVNGYTSKSQSVTIENDSVILINANTYPEYIMSFPQGTYAFSGNFSGLSQGVTAFVQVASISGDGDSFDKRVGRSNSDGTSSNTFTITNQTSVRIRVYLSANSSTPVTVNKIQIESGSSATSYAPYSNICPISGHDTAVVTRTGKNLLPDDGVYPTTKNGITVIKNADGSLSLSGTKTTSDVIFTVHNFTDNLQKYQGKYLHSQLSSNVGIVATYYDENNRWLSVQLTKGTQLDIPQNAKRMQVAVRVATSSDVTGSTLYPMISDYPDDTFEPYQGTSVTIDLDGTRYGGVIDVLTGEMTVDRAMVDLGTLNWTLDTSYNAFYSYEVIDAKSHPYTQIIGLITSIGFEEVGKMTAGTDDLTICLNSASHTANKMYIKYIKYTTAIDFKTAMSGVQLVYPLATPLTVTLSPSQLSTLLGTNNIWADTGDVLNLTYRTDTKKYIEQKVADTNRKTCEMMTIVTDKMIAPDNLVIGDLVIVNNDLYKATANIASGATMMVGTNVQKLTLAEYIQSLL